MSAFKRVLGRLDIELLEKVNVKGTIDGSWFSINGNVRYKRALVRCKARMLIVPILKNRVFMTIQDRLRATYDYQLTDLGKAVLEALA